VSKPSALFDPDAAQDKENNYCKREFKNTWARPYLAQYTVNTEGDLVVDKIAAGVTVGLGTEATAAGGRKRFFAHLSNVPMDIIRQALIECNNTDETQGDLAKNRCRTSGDLAGTEPADFDMLYDTTR
jgi:hypothetical protein